MSLKSIDPTQTLAWKKLQAHFETIKDVHMSSLFSKNFKRASEMSLEWNDFFPVSYTHLTLPTNREV